MAEKHGKETKTDLLKRLARNIVKYETFKERKVPNSDLRPIVNSIADTVDKLIAKGDIDCNKLRLFLEEELIQKCKLILSSTSCANCENLSACEERLHPCNKCVHYYLNDYSHSAICAKCDSNNVMWWKFKENAHRKCRDYELDDWYVGSVLSNTISMAEVLTKKYKINKKRVKNEINALTEHLFRLIKEHEEMW